MIGLVAEREAVCFSHNGKQYAMYPEEIEAAYRYQERQYRLQDAERQLMYLCFGEEVEDDEIESSNRRDKITDALDSFEDDYGISYAEARQHLDAIVLKFEMGQDCGVDENSQWENAIKGALKDLSEQIGLHLPF